MTVVRSRDHQNVRGAKENRPPVDRNDVSDDPVLEHIEMVYRARFSDFLRVATATAGSVELGQDAVQEAFVTAIRRRHQYRGEGSV